MKKTFLTQFDYLDDCDGVAESFGTNPQEMADVVLQAVKLQNEYPSDRGTTILLRMVESEQITGGQLMSLAMLGLNQALEAQTSKSAMLHFLRHMMEEVEGVEGGEDPACY